MADDEKNEREGMKFLIRKEKLPFHVSEAANGKQALAVMEEREIDILLTDVKMPYMDGLELSMAVHRSRPDTQIIIFSAYNEFDYVKKAMQAQAVNYLLKPIELDEFSQVMKKVIETLEAKQEEKQKIQSLMEADKKMLLGKLLLKKADAELLQQLESHGLSLAGQHVLLAQVETKDSFFDGREEIFLKLLDSAAPYPYEYFNLYPHESYLIFYSPQKFSKAKIEEMYGQLNHSLQRTVGTCCSCLLGCFLEDALLLEQEMKRLQRLQREIYENKPVLLWADEYENREFRVGAVEEIRGSLKEAVRTKSLPQVKLLVGKLIHAVAESKSMSIIYIHHVFYDIIDSLYTNFGEYQPDTVYSRINQVLGCTDEEQLAQVFSGIWQELERREDAALQDRSALTEQVKKIIRQEYYQDLSLDTIAERVNLAPSYLSYIFKRETGDNLIKYITDIRMEKAGQLLTETNMKIVQVARECGYENTSYFNRLFKNYFGVSPRQYKENTGAD